MSDEQGRYRINWVSEQTGISEATLRAWERRYRVPEPARTPSGYRVYSVSDVQKVRRMRELCDGGMPPSEAALAVAQRRPRPESADELRLTQKIGRAQLGRAHALSPSGVLALVEHAALTLAAARLGKPVTPIACGPLQLECEVLEGDDVIVMAWLESAAAERVTVEVNLAVAREGHAERNLASTRVELQVEATDGEPL
jgi:DNA-binding transcriptional MerR regulator